MIKSLIKKAAGKIGRGAGGAAASIASESGMKSLVKTIGKSGFTEKHAYKLSKKILNKGFKQSATRAATIAAISKNQADARKEVAKYNYQTYLDALDRYNRVINQTAQPAEGTGEPEGPQNNPSEVTPVGNS